MFRCEQLGGFGRDVAPLRRIADWQRLERLILAQQLSDAGSVDGSSGQERHTAARIRRAQTIATFERFVEIDAGVDAGWRASGRRKEERERGEEERCKGGSIEKVEGCGSEGGRER